MQWSASIVQPKHFNFILKLEKKLYAHINLLRFFQAQYLRSDWNIISVVLALYFTYYITIAITCALAEYLPS